MGPRNASAAPARGATSLGMTTNMADAAPAAAHLNGSDRRCRVCDTTNAPNLRYCTSCGSTLDPAPVATAAPVPPPSPAIPSPASAIVSVGVVGLANGATGGTRTCERCKGTADAGAQFCRFCGNSLADAPPPPPPATTQGSRANGATSAHANRPATAPIVQVASQVLSAMRPAPAQPVPTPAPSPVGPSAPSSSSSETPSTYGPPPGPPALAKGTAAPISAPRSAPAASVQRGRLVVIAKSGADGPSYPFGDVLDIGRVEGNVIVGEDPYLSPRHARILWDRGKVVLRDLGSTNGVYLRLAPSRDTSSRHTPDSPEISVPLADQDLILVGQQVLRFDILKEAEGGFGPAQEHGTLLFGSPAAPRYARLCQRTVEGITRDVYYIRKVETVLGRESGDVVFTEDPFLSRRHAAVRLLSRDGLARGTSSRPPPGDARFALVDLGSSNGTFLRIRSEVELTPGDHFRVGQQLFRVDFDGVRG